MGNNQSGGEVAAEIFKKVGSVALAVSYFTPAAVIAVPVTAGAAVAGGAVTAIGYAADAEEAKKVGKWFVGLATDATIDGISGGALEGVKMSRTTAQAIKTGVEILSDVDKYENAARGTPSFPTPDPKHTLLLAQNAEFFVKNIF